MDNLRRQTLKLATTTIAHLRATMRENLTHFSAQESDKFIASVIECRSNEGVHIHRLWFFLGVRAFRSVDRITLSKTTAMGGSFLSMAVHVATQHPETNETGQWVVLSTHKAQLVWPSEQWSDVLDFIDDMHSQLTEGQVAA